MSIEFKKRHCNEGFKIFLVVNGHYFIERWRYYGEAFILEGDSILAQLKKDNKLKEYIVYFNEVYYGNDKEKIKWINRIENELREGNKMEKCRFKIGDEIKHYDYKLDALEHTVTGVTDDGKILIDNKEEECDPDDYLFYDEPDTEFE